MASRLPEGAALLVAGYGTAGVSGFSASALLTLGQIGETLLATAAPWRIRRLSPAAGERYTPDRASLKRQLVELTQQPVEVALLAAAGVMTIHLDKPAFVAGSDYREYPDDATLSLSWIHDRFHWCRAERSVMVLSAENGDPTGTARAWLNILGTNHPTHIVAVHEAGPGVSALDALLAGLSGEAIDPSTGTVTLFSLGEHLLRKVPGIALQGSGSRETVAGSPPLGGRWNLRLSHLAFSRTAPAAVPPTEAIDDLTHVVLPGRFRIEGELAKGSFGTVYRARQLSVERDVAIKVLHAGVDATTEDSRLFVQEIQSVGRLDHTNVVRIYQADITPDGRLFFAMELLIGRDLQQIINDEGRLEPERALGLVRQLLAGLNAAHDAGLVHADVKPANAFVVSGRGGERLVLLDFGLARLRPAGRAAQSAGGTPAYMAPEQLNEGRVDARSDLFSVGLVLMTLLTGWRRESADQLVPPLDEISDDNLRAALVRALALDPVERFQTAAEFADALLGRVGESSPTMVTRPPFRHLAPLTERDLNRLHGRERDVAALTDHVLYRRVVVFTAASGTGKTSLLRAGLVPRLEALGVRAVYLPCRADVARTLAAAIWPGSQTVADALQAWSEQRRGKLVVILDQLELVLSDPGTLREAVAFDRWPVDADISIVLSVREDFLARLIGWSQYLAEGIPVVRLPPLGVDGARVAIGAPLAEARLSIAPELMEALLDDLQAAATAIGPEMGWGDAAAVYPPHLQLVCSVLCEALGPGESTLTLAHYRRLGGLDAIVGEYLDRVLETELDAEAATVARDPFLTLVTSAHTRAMRTDAELVEIVGGRHGPDKVVNVLTILHARGLLVRVRSGDHPGWELVHDSLVPRVLGWIDRRDLARRRAMEVVRYHLRRSRPDAPSLLTRTELRELRGHADAIPELEAEWSHRRGEIPWTPAGLVRASRRFFRRRDLFVGGAGILVLGIAALATARGLADSARRRAEEVLLGRDMGRFALELAPFDWDVAAHRAVAVSLDSLPRLEWEIHEADPEDLDSPGNVLAAPLVVRGASALAADHRSRIDHVEARSGKAFLLITGRGEGAEPCPPSVVPLRHIPGYAQRDQAEPVFRIRVPTCQATHADMIPIPAGGFVHNGLGEPASKLLASAEGEQPERIITLPAFLIDRTEVINAAFSVYAQMEEITGMSMPDYPVAPGSDYERADGAVWPVAGISWAEARAYCRSIGKDLPTSEQWQKAMRGGLLLPGDVVNPMPRRNLPWGEPRTPVPAKLRDVGVPGPAPVGTFPGDVSPYGVVDMAGNVQEWTGSIPSLSGKPVRRFRITRGANWDDTATTNSLVEYMIENSRFMALRNFALGMRCVLSSE